MAGLWVSARILLIITAQAFTTEQTTVVPCCYIKGPESHHTCKKNRQKQTNKTKKQRFFSYRNMDKDTAWCVSVRKLQDWCPITELHTFYTNTFYIYWTLYGDVSSYQLCLLICFVFLQSRNHIPEQIPMIFLLRGMCKWGNLSLKKKKGGGKRNENSKGKLATKICLSLLQTLVQNGEMKKIWGLSSCVYSE